MVDLVEAVDERGIVVSPILPEDCKNYLIDIDGTICEDIPNEEPERMATAKVFDNVAEQINKWYDEGHQICFFTSISSALIASMEFRFTRPKTSS